MRRIGSTRKMTVRKLTEGDFEGMRRMIDWDEFEFKIFLGCYNCLIDKLLNENQYKYENNE